ncbi:TIGR03905 family TSCPD domain-containing protein [Crassaminicella thermophila]|uniref:ribonucleoside-diphosphate reductase n=1 Tax=Crassaminicella thermophila TaxID=2599308 RepID=A0A5C0SH41_CRATE|nr:TIGR03905 family TSCPD domain-containing protein [Crassaminicella thermophila]QEK12548.1 TIGR03905 family TSCPD domain-containing protein [Crassaminicella thermophila]
MYIYKTSGVCSKQIEFSVENNVIKKVKFYGGCPGNLQGISKLVEGMHVDEAIKRLSGITCGPKSTSCPDQLSKALVALKEKIA